MPSANPVLRNMISGKDYLMNPMKPAIVIVEHKIRNLEKRKAKLDQYKSEQDEGKELNADQLAAVAKYGEVAQQLEFARDLVKQFSQVNDESRREIKKDQKAEQADRALAESERLRDFFKIQALINELKCDPTVLEDFISRTEGTPEVDKDVFVRLSSDPFLQMAPIRRMDNDYEMAIETVSTNWMHLIEGSRKEYSGSGAKTTFKKMKEALLAMSDCEYFANKASRYEVPADEVLSDTDSATAIPEAEPVAAKPIPSESITTIIPPRPASIVPIQESTYSFLQESQIDLESPHMDPAVVAVSSFVPPPQLLSQQAEYQRPVYNTSNNSSTHSANTSGSMDDMKIDFAQKHDPLAIDNEITEWTNPMQITSEDKNKDRNEEKYEWNGNYRGGPPGRGRPNRREYTNGFNRGGPRGGNRAAPGGPPGGFSNGRMGYYRPESQENGFDNKEYRGGRGGGAGREGGRGGYSRGGGGPRGNSQGNNFNTYSHFGPSAAITANARGNGGYRGSPRGRPQQRESNGMTTTQCY